MSLDKKSKQELLEIIEQGESGKLLADLQAANNTIADLEAKLASGTGGNSDLVQENTDLKTQVAEQAKIIAAHDTTKGDDTPLVHRASGTYQVVAGARTEDGAFTKKEVATNDALFDKLLGKGYPGIRKVA